MNELPFLSARMVDVTIPRLRARGLETRLALDGRTITFDRKGTPIGPVDVVIAWAARQPVGAGTAATNVVGIDGEVQGRPGELTARAGDLFMLDGATAEITVHTRIERGVAVAPFRLVQGKVA